MTAPHPLRKPRRERRWLNAVAWRTSAGPSVRHRKRGASRPPKRFPALTLGRAWISYTPPTSETRPHQDVRSSTSARPTADWSLCAQGSSVNRVHIKTYGCQMNERDSEAVAAILRAGGYRVVAEENNFDILLLNTFSVRD